MEHFPINQAYTQRHTMPPPQSDSDSNNILPLLVPGDESYPLFRSIANYAANKLSSLSESDISFLSDDALSRLIESELNRLPEEELNRLVDAVISPFVPVVDSILRSIFSPFLSKPKRQEELTEEDLSMLAFHNKCFAIVTALASTFVVFDIFFKLWLVDRWSSFKRRHEVTVTNIIATQDKLKPSKRSIYLSKYSRTLYLKGLKAIGETYIQETDTGFR